MKRQALGRSGRELALTLMVLAWLFWLARGLHHLDALQAPDNRYQRDIALTITVSGAAARSDWLDSVCPALASALAATDRATCPGYTLAPTSPTADLAAPLATHLAALETAHSAWRTVFFQLLQAAEQARATWEEQAREGFAEMAASQADADRWQQQTQLYRETYRLNVQPGAAYSRPLECAWSYLSRHVKPNDKNAAAALAGLAAVLDGRPKRLPGSAFKDGWNAREQANGCRDAVRGNGLTTPLDAARSAASLLRQAHDSRSNAAKAQATLVMLPKVGWQLLGWGLAGWLVLRLGRRAVYPTRLLSLGLLIWALAYTVTGPYLAWLWGGLAGWGPALWLSGAALLLWWLPCRQRSELSIPASSLAYPGFVLFAGLGWLILLDLSATGYPDNRFHGLYQQAYLFAAFLLVSLLPVLRLGVARWGLLLWGFWPLAAAGFGKRAKLGWTLATLLVAALLVITKLLLTGHRHNTSEVFRLLLLYGVGWFLFVRGEALLSPWLARRFQPATPRRGLWAIQVKLAWPLILLLALVGGGFYLTDDFGPLLVMLYAAALFGGMSLARLAAPYWGAGRALLLGMAAVMGYVWLTSFALLRYGDRINLRIAERLESAATPFLASNDQIAHILWFQDAVLRQGWTGFGLGAAPWCGDLSGVCRGVPVQIQSDYLFTALVGVFGVGSWALVWLMVLWLWRLARAHSAATTGQVDGDRPAVAWLGWLTLGWAGLTLVQLAITVAGNQAWLPLTGITFPFLSYGAWSLLGHAHWVGLALNLPRRT